MKRHTLELTYEKADGAEIQVRFIYLVSPGQAERIHCLPEDATPYEPPEIELTNIHVELEAMNGEMRWFDAAPKDFEIYRLWGEQFEDEMLENDNGSVVHKTIVDTEYLNEGRDALSRLRYQEMTHAVR